MPTPSLSRVTSAIQIKITAKVKDGDFEKGGKVSIVSGVLKTETIQDWGNWRLVDERWIHDLWDWTQFDPERLDDNKYKLLASQSGSAFIQNEEFTVIKEREEKILILATICLLFNHWKRKAFSSDRQAIHLGHLSFGINATRGLACSPKVGPDAMRDWRRDSTAELST